MSVSLPTVDRTRRRFVEGILGRALSEEPRPGAEHKLIGKEEALLVAAKCAKPPAGRKRWTLDAGRWTLTLLADTMVKLTDHDSLSGEAVRRRPAENAQAMAQGHVVHSSCRRRIRRTHGGRARPLCRGRLEFHFTPKHASWLNMVDVQEADIV